VDGREALPPPPSLLVLPGAAACDSSMTQSLGSSTTLSSVPSTPTQQRKSLFAIATWYLKLTYCCMPCLQHVALTSPRRLTWSVHLHRLLPDCFTNSHRLLLLQLISQGLVFRPANSVHAQAHQVPKLTARAHRTPIPASIIFKCSSTYSLSRWLLLFFMSNRLLRCSRISPD
jgi:hypothetical protein